MMNFHCVWVMHLVADVYGRVDYDDDMRSVRRSVVLVNHSCAFYCRGCFDNSRHCHSHHCQTRSDRGHRYDAMIDNHRQIHFCHGSDTCHCAMTRMKKKSHGDVKIFLEGFCFYFCCSSCVALPFVFVWYLFCCEKISNKKLSTLKVQRIQCTKLFLFYCNNCAFSLAPSTLFSAAFMYHSFACLKCFCCSKYSANLNWACPCPCSAAC